MASISVLFQLSVIDDFPKHRSDFSIRAHIEYHHSTVLPSNTCMRVGAIRYVIAEVFEEHIAFFLLKADDLT